MYDLLKIAHNLSGNIISFVKLNVWLDVCFFLLIFGFFSGVWSLPWLPWNIWKPLVRLMSSVASLTSYYLSPARLPDLPFLKLPPHPLCFQQPWAFCSSQLKGAIQERGKDERSVSSSTRKRVEERKGLAKGGFWRDSQEYVERTTVRLWKNIRDAMLKKIDFSNMSQQEGPNRFVSTDFLKL